MGFKSTHAEHNGLVVHRLNHSAIGCVSQEVLQQKFGNIWKHQPESVLGCHAGLVI